MNTRHTAAMLGGFKSRGEEKLKASQTHCHKQYFLIATRTIRADRKDEILLAGICQGNLVPKPPYRSPKRAAGHGHCGERSEPQMKGGRV